MIVQHFVPYVLIKKAAELTGYSVRAIELKIARGVWVEGREWRKAPDGHRMISIEGVRRWVEQGNQKGSMSLRDLDSLNGKHDRRDRSHTAE